MALERLSRMIRALAPAKLNLGLEILRRRDDGFHEIRTIFCAVSLFDRLTIAKARANSVLCNAPIDTEENLVSIAMRKAQSACSGLPHAAVTIEKRVPAAAGLGGASSDAAATLLALNCLTDRPLTVEQLTVLGAQCGSDIPFFFHSGLALGTGRGEQLIELPFTPLHAVIVTPAVAIPDKTRTMYARIRPEHWTSGEHVEHLTARLARGAAPNPVEQLPNAFSRPLYDFYPEIGSLASQMEALLGRSVQVTGAGPSLYVLCADAADATSVSEALRILPGADDRTIHRVRSVSAPLIVESPDV
jgi:4-diphosphocytidyl-2-C-methyl-D-erythritol kinase